jgi:vacuolar protein sorting-associated protein 54
LLSSHLDTLERHLIHEITLRSSAFFSALSNLQDLHSESASCLTRISDLQASLRDVGSKQAQKGLEIIDAQDRLYVLRATERSVRTVAELEELVRVANSLVEAGDWAGGLGYLTDIVRWWERYGADPDARDDRGDAVLPLSTLPALSTLPDSVASLTSTISSQLETALSSLLLSVLSETIGSDSPYAKSLKASVEPILCGLLRCGKADRVEDIWREVLTTSIREGSRKVSLADRPMARFGLTISICRSAKAKMMRETKKVVRQRREGELEECSSCLSQS